MDEKYVGLFKSLNQSETGRLLVEYLQQLQNKVCDARNNDLDDQVRKAVADILQKEVIDEILLVNKDREVRVKDYE